MPARVPVARGLEPHERLRRRWQTVVRDAGALILHRDCRGPLVRFDPDRDGPTIANGILDQIGYRAAHCRPVDAGEDGIRLVKGDLRALVAEFGDDLADNAGKVGRSAHHSRRVARQREDPFKIARQPVDRADHVLSHGFVLDQFHLDAQRGERRAQIMADRTEHHVAFAQHLHDPLLHSVNGRDQRPHVGRA